MTEPAELTSARRHLAKAQAMLMTEDGLYHLNEGLALLETVIAEYSSTQRASVARNLGQAYTDNIYEHIRRKVGDDSSLPEPELEHLFSVIRTFDDSPFDLPPDSSDLKIAVVKRLVDFYYEGCSSAEKEKAYRQLAEIVGTGR